MSSSTIVSQPWLALSTLIALFAVLLTFMKNICSKIPRQRLPPGPPGLPIIGNLHQLGPLPHQNLWKLSQKYGPLIYLKLGAVPTVIASSPETAKEILKTHDIECCSRPPLAGTGRLSYGFLDVAFSPFDEYWKEIRKICMLELFNSRRVESFGYIREEEIDSLIGEISQYAVSGTTVDLSQTLVSTIAAVICRIGFGMRLRGSKNDNKRFQEVLNNEAIEMLGSFSAEDFFPYVGWIIDRLTGLYQRREKCFHDLDEFYEQVIKYHLENKSQEAEEAADIVDVLLKIEKEQAGNGVNWRLTKNHIKGILMDILIGGIDTSSITIVWAMTELIRNPNVMKKAQSEIRNHIGSRGRVTADDLGKLEYLQLLMKETWRLHPPVTLLLPREAISKFQLYGYDINPKTRIQVNVWAFGRDPNVWKDPEEFCPERFIDNSMDVKGQDFELLPFGSGRRICPGISMGMAMVHLTLANLLYKFDWKLPEGMNKADVDMEEAPGLANHKKNHLKLVPIRYNEN